MASTRNLRRLAKHAPSSTSTLPADLTAFAKALEKLEGLPELAKTLEEAHASVAQGLTALHAIQREQARQRWVTLRLLADPPLGGVLAFEARERTLRTRFDEAHPEET